MNEDLPKQELLIKIMGMTTSDNDGQALVALRKANALLEAAGWSWEKLIQGRIRVVENPFKGSNPFASRERIVTPQGPAPTPHQTYTKQPMPAYKPTPPPDPLHYGTPSNPISSVRNKFANFCYCCGKDTPAQAGFLFDPWNFNKKAASKWQVICVSCNTSAPIHPLSALPIRTKKAAVSDLA